MSKAEIDMIRDEFPYVKLKEEHLGVGVMTHFLIALMFPIATGFYFFGLSIVRALVVCIVTSVLTELLCNKVLRQKSTLGDLTAIATGVVIALNMRPGLTVYPMILASIIGIVIGKYIFGGFGYNPINPAVIGRLIPVAGFPGIWATSIRPTIPTLMSKANLSYWEATQYVFVRDITTLPFYQKVRSIQPVYINYSFSEYLNGYYDVLSGTTFLETVKNWYKSGVMPRGMQHSSELFDYWALFFGNIPGVLGETAKWAILLGFLYLVITKIISPIVPMLIWVFMCIFGWVFGATRLGAAGIGPVGLFAGDPLLWLLSGGVIFGSVYMETDPVSSPRTMQAKVLYSFLFVSIVTAIRLVFSFPEGVSFALLSCNLMIPLIDRFCHPDNRFSKKIKYSLISLAVVISIFLSGMLVYKQFFQISPYEQRIQEMLPNFKGTVTQKKLQDGTKYYVLKESGEVFAKGFLVAGQKTTLGVAFFVLISKDKLMAISVFDSVNTAEENSDRVIQQVLKKFIGKTKDSNFFSPDEIIDLRKDYNFPYEPFAMVQAVQNAFIEYEQTKRIGEV